jgi:hypothetical protein
MPNTRIRRPALVAFAPRLARNANTCQRGKRIAAAQDPAAKRRETAFQTPNPTSARKKKRFVQNRLNPARAMLRLHDDLARTSLVADAGVA